MDKREAWAIIFSFLFSYQPSQHTPAMPALAPRLPVRSVATRAPAGRRAAAVAVRAVKARCVEWGEEAKKKAPIVLHSGVRGGEQELGACACTRLRACIAYQGTARPPIHQTRQGIACLAWWSGRPAAPLPDKKERVAASPVGGVALLVTPPRPPLSHPLAHPKTRAGHVQGLPRSGHGYCPGGMAGPRAAQAGARAFPEQTRRRRKTSPFDHLTSPPLSLPLSSPADAPAPAPAPTPSAAMVAAATSILAAAIPAPALAAASDNHLLTGQLVSLLHPAMMFFLFGASGWAGWLGWQWRRTREIGGEIKDLKAGLPAAGPDGVRPAAPALESQIAGLEATRKTLIAGNYRDKHHNWGSLLLALGVLIAIEGPVNTFLRTGKLFPGPHLYAGAGIVILWAAAAALVPAMQKGDDNARTLHMTLNGLNLALFAWQIPTGLEIVAKVFQFTTLP